MKQETEVHQTMLTLEQLLMMADAVNATEAGARAETATVTWIQVALLVYLVCEAQGVDCPTFLAVANFISEEQYSYSGNESDFSIPALMDYLKRAHTYFLDFNLPAIRRKLIEAIDCSSTNDVAYLILKFFDEYAKEVRRHMEYENQAVFTYVEQLLQGNLSDEYNIATFASKHNQIDTKLKELKNIIIKYYPEKENNNLLNAVLFDIFNCEQDLATHCQVEDYMFVPAVAQIERKLKNEQ